MKTGSKRRQIYWDSTCWLAWLHGEGTDIWPAAVVTGIRDVVEEIEKRRIILFTSTLTRGEIFQGRLNESQKEMYSKLLRRRNVIEVIPDGRIMDRASAIREYHANQKEKRKIATPDATHLATAIIYQSDEFQTMDGLQKGGSKHRKLLALSGNVGGYNLKIVHPYPLNEPPPKELVGVHGPLFTSQAAEQTNERKDKS